MWISQAVNPEDTVESLFILESPEIATVLAIVTPGGSTLRERKSIRAFDLTNGTLLWTAPACHLGSLNFSDDDLSMSPLVAARSCDNVSILLHSKTGADITAAFFKSIDFEQEVEWSSADEGVGQLTRVAELSWGNFGPAARRNGKDVQLISRPNAELAVRAVGGWEDLVTRHEGAAHTVAGTFISSQRKLGGAPDILVTLSEYGTLFGFDVRGGVQRWVHEVDLNDDSLNKRNCSLVAGHVYHVSVVCVNELADGSFHTAVAVVDAATGGGLMGVHVHPFRAAHAFVHARCCSPHDTCVHLVDASGSERVVSTCDDAYVATRTGAPDSPVYVSARTGGESVTGLRGGRVAWRFQIPSGSRVERIALARRAHPAARRARRRPVRVTADRNLLYKFTDPSALLVLAAPKDSDDESLLAVVLDAVSGVVLKAVSHVNATAPFSAVRGDNWFVYSYWNSYLLQQELHVIDMYEPSTNSSFIMEKARAFIADIVAPAFHIAGIELPIALRDLKLSDEGVCTGMDAKSSQCPAGGDRLQQIPPNPVLLHMSFVLSHQVLELDVSDTEGGVTERSVLFALASGQVVSLSRLGLDARRPMSGGMDPTESLAQYYPYISFLASHSAGEFVTRDQYLSGVVGLAVAPAPKQESLCHVAAFGVDIFYNKIAPAGRFDSLPDDFRFGAVIASIAILCIAALYSELVLETKELSEAW